MAVMVPDETPTAQTQIPRIDFAPARRTPSAVDQAGQPGRQCPAYGGDAAGDAEQDVSRLDAARGAASRAGSAGRSGDHLLGDRAAGGGVVVEHASRARRPAPLPARRPAQRRPGCRGSCPGRRPGCARGRRRRRAGSGPRGRCRRPGGGPGIVNPTSRSVTVVRRGARAAAVEDVLDECDRRLLGSVVDRRHDAEAAVGQRCDDGESRAVPEEDDLVGGRLTGQVDVGEDERLVVRFAVGTRCLPARAPCCACRRRRRRSGRGWCRRRRTSRSRRRRPG